MDVKVTLENQDPALENHVFIMEVPDNCITDEMVELFIRNNSAGALLEWKRLDE